MPSSDGGRPCTRQPASAVVPSPRRPDQTSEDLLSALSATLVVEHEDARLSYDDGVFRSVIRRQLTNVGDQPVTRYLIRIAVDRYPGDPERSNRLYREHPLTWEEIGLSATCRGEPMTWLVKHDRDAFKELWLLFANDDGLFPLYPGETTWIEYSYTVGRGQMGAMVAACHSPPHATAEPHLGYSCRLGACCVGDGNLDDCGSLTIPDAHCPNRPRWDGGVSHGQPMIRRFTLDTAWSGSSEVPPRLRGTGPT